MRASVNDVHHRDGHDIGICSADVSVKRDIQIVGGSFCHSQGYAQNSICAQF